LFGWLPLLRRLRSVYIPDSTYIIIVKKDAIQVADFITDNEMLFLT